MATERVAKLTLCRQGDHIVAANTLYGGTVSQLWVTFARFGIACTFVEPAAPASALSTPVPSCLTSPTSATRVRL